MIMLRVRRADRLGHVLGTVAKKSGGGVATGSYGHLSPSTATAQQQPPQHRYSMHRSLSWFAGSVPFQMQPTSRVPSFVHYPKSSPGSSSLRYFSKSNGVLLSSSSEKTGQDGDSDDSSPNKPEEEEEEAEQKEKDDATKHRDEEGEEKYEQDNEKPVEQPAEGGKTGFDLAQQDEVLFDLMEDETNASGTNSPDDSDASASSSTSAVSQSGNGRTNEEPTTEPKEMIIMDPQEQTKRIIAQWNALTTPRQVDVIPLYGHPFLPGSSTTITIQDASYIHAVQQMRQKGGGLCGAFFVRNKEMYRDNEMQPPITSVSQVHHVGVLAKITNLWLNEYSRDKVEAVVILYALRRIRIVDPAQKPISPSDRLSVEIEEIRPSPYNKDSQVLKAYKMEIVNLCRELISHGYFYKEHLQEYLETIGGDAGTVPLESLADVVAQMTTADDSSLQEFLEVVEMEDRFNKATQLLKAEIEVAKTQKGLQSVDEKISADQRRQYLEGQLKTIKKELGLDKGTDEKEQLISKFRERLVHKVVPEAAQRVINDEISKISTLEISSTEYNVTRNYLDWLTILPWGVHTKDILDIHRAQRILDEDHYGLKDIKERIVEFIAVGKLKGSVHGKILCLVGPPGVGKTSIGKSVARALNREFFRFSVGGMDDVAEIKGHRRTYVGAMPGKLLQSLKLSKSANPVIMIDEIDKMGRTHRGDPSSALLEVLDPEQNASFLDHYLDVAFDLSKVLFICTANSLDPIPKPLLDRMEILRLSGYVLEEKLAIAKKYLLPTIRKETAVNQHLCDIKDSALHELIKSYCREAGVRNLQKHIDKIVRKAAYKIVKKGGLRYLGPISPAITKTEDGANRPLTDSVGTANLSTQDASTLDILGMDKEAELAASAVDNVIVKHKGGRPSRTPKLPASLRVIVSKGNLSEFVGQPLFTTDRFYDRTPVGVTMGLAWTEMGGSTLYIETSLNRMGPSTSGTGSLKLTGQAGDVMKESSEIAYSFVKSFVHDAEGVPASAKSFFETSSIHMHIPEGATPKDGPSAGITMVTSLLSLALNKPVRHNLSMTGELTLTGKVLDIGGVKEKTIAAKRSGIEVLIFPSGNKKNWDELEDYIKAGLEVHFVSSYEDVFGIAFDGGKMKQSLSKSKQRSPTANMST